MTSPPAEGGSCPGGVPSMTLRDWFAGQYLAGNPMGEGQSYASHADDAYMVADALLQERGRDPLTDAAGELLGALEGIVADDGPSVSLKDQRARWEARMEAARAAIRRATGAQS